MYINLISLYTVFLLHPQFFVFWLIRIIRDPCNTQNKTSIIFLRFFYYRGVEKLTNGGSIYENFFFL